MQVRLLNCREYERWYHEYLCRDFPVNEVKPLKDMIDMNCEGRYDVLLYENDSVEVGYVTVWKRQGLTTYLLDYLGVPEKLRNMGIGKEILRRVRDDVSAAEGRAGLYMVLESETPNCDDDSEENILRRRRLNFYMRNGWVKMYEMATCGVRFTAMSFEEVPENIENVMIEHKNIYGEIRDDVIIPLPHGMKPPLPYWMK